MAGEVVEPDGARYSYIRCGCTEGAHLERTAIMMRKHFATASLAGMVIIGAAAFANATPTPSESGPSMSNSATTTTTTTSATSGPTYPGHSGY
jgi:hypothetical protein